MNSHFSNAMSGDVSMGCARAAYAPRGMPPLAARRHVILIDRGRSARSLGNAAAVKQALGATLPRP